MNLLHRIRNIFVRGRITLVDDSGPIQSVQVRTNELETSDNRIRMAEFGFASNPPDGSDALVLHIAGERYDGAVIATNHQPSRPTGLSAGESMLYSQDGKYVYVTASGGIVVEAKGQDVVVNDARNVTWNCSGDFTQNVGGKYKVVAAGGVEFDTSLVKSSGDMQDNFSTNPHTLAQMRAIENGHTHQVTGVQSGSSTVTSNSPNQTE